MAKESPKKLAKKNVAKAIAQAKNRTLRKSPIKAAKPAAVKAAKPVAVKAAKPAAVKAAKPVALKEIKKPAVPKAVSPRAIAPKALRAKTLAARAAMASEARSAAKKPVKPLSPKATAIDESADVPDLFAFPEQGPKPVPRVHHVPLTARERQGLKKALVEERNRIIAFLDSLDGKSLNHAAGEGERDRSSYSIHQADYASDNQSLNLALAQRQIESARLEEIEWAFKQVETKTYGRCRRCTANIGFDRMQAKPYAEYCIVCHSEMEPAR